MSIPVPIDRLAAELERFGEWGYLLTTGEDGRPHAVQAAIRLEGDELLVQAGRRTAANAAAHPSVAMLWVPWEPDGFNLIVDGEAVGHGPDDDDDDGDGVLHIAPTKGVLHRSRPAPGPVAEGACGNDCVPLG